ncbi:MAG: polyprenyl synthetase family protein [Chloroflexi bacterium]|nr:polyprenyl synthetase family protein [Chloroflexota bacterium]
MFPIAYHLVEKELAQVTQHIRDLACSDSRELEEILSLVLENTGKRLRPTLCLVSGLFYRYDPSLLVPMAAGVELFHTATLVHDDTIDHAEVRRGRPTVSRAWGDHTAVMVGDYLLACAAKLVASTGNLRAIEIFAETLRVVCDGEIRQELSAYALASGMDQYLERITKKTAYLFASAAECGAIVGGAPEEATRALHQYGLWLGTAFQMVDDILDFTATPEQLGKPSGTDLEQGTLTLPAILFLQQGGRQSLVQQGWERPISRERVNAAVEAIRDSGAIAESLEQARKMGDKARRCLQVLPPAPARRALEELVDYVVQRPN